MRRLALAAPLALLAAAAAAGPLAIDSRPVPFSEETPLPDRVGALRFEGALALSSADERFGGISGIEVSPAGGRLFFVTDRGAWITAVPRHDRDGRLAGIGDARIGALAGPGGSIPDRKRDRDAESLAWFGGGFAVAFERRHRIWRYRAAPAPFAAPPVEIALPVALDSGPDNGGIEALAALADGSLVAIAEDYPRDGAALYGWVRRRGAWRRFLWRREALFRPSGATLLPDGDLLVLERRFTYLGGFAARLVRVSPAVLRAGATVSGHEIARIEPPLIEENFEGVAAHRTTDGGTRLYLVSDDNFLGLQRTLLVQFALLR